MTVTDTGNSMMVAVTIPKVVNSGEESITLTSANLVHTHARQFFNVTSVAISATRGAVTLGTAVTIAPGGIATNVSFTSTYVNPVNASVNNGGSTTTETFDYTHLLLLSASSIEVWINVRNDSGTALPNTNYTASNIDFLNDADDDGVPDYSEGLAGTNPDLATSKPEALSIDVMVVYTAALAAAENNEPMTRIMRDVMWANMALDRSGIDAEYNVVGNKEVTYTEQNFDTILRAMMDETAPFVGIDTERAAAGADLLMLYMKLDGAGSGGSTCGRATVPGVRREGDMFFIERGTVVSAVGVGTGCQTGTLAHELGHNLGLGHSARQTDSVGTWIWSRGHGVTDGFVTVMGYASSFNVTADKIEQIYSTPDVSTCGASDDLPCGLARTDTNGADATRSIKATMYQIAALTDAVAPADPDTDGDGEVNSVDLDDDDDGLTDVEEAALGTNPLLADTDGDTVNDNIDAFPLDATETVDTDGDMVGANADANDNDASVTWTRTNVTLPADATVATNLIATFDDTTEDPAAIRAGRCPASARYQVTFTSRWNANSHGNSPPYPAGRSPHFTSLVGSTHNSQVTFWQRGQLATPGIESIAELGSTSTFRTTDQANARAAGNAGAYLNLGGLGAYPSSATRQIDVSEDFPLLTLASMIAPTPDWFVGVSGFNLKEGSRGCWKRRITENLVGNDAGTETGTGYSLGNPAESPTSPSAPSPPCRKRSGTTPLPRFPLLFRRGMVQAVRARASTR